MAPKLKPQMKPTKKTSITKKRNRAQPPPDLLSSEDESGPQVQDLMDARVIITTHLSAATATRRTHEAPPLPDQATGSDQPPKGPDIHSRDIQFSPDYGTLLDIKKEARARLVEGQRGASTGYFHNTDEESGPKEPP